MKKKGDQEESVCLCERYRENKVEINKSKTKKSHLFGMLREADRIGQDCRAAVDNNVAVVKV